jgi:aminoglycoside 6'-N-acetyltransferase I
VESIVVRQAAAEDLDQVASMAHLLWPDGTATDHARDLAPLLAGNPPGQLPAVVLVAEEPEGRVVGFVHVGLRSHADGCDTAHAVGFLEGWYVELSSRRKGVGAALVAAAEDWARRQGCREMASDTWIDAADSQRAHEALGFEVVDRCVNYRKSL